MRSVDRLRAVIGGVVGGDNAWPRQAEPDVGGSLKLPAVVYRLSGGETRTAGLKASDLRHDFELIIVTDDEDELWAVDERLARALRDAGLTVGPPADLPPDDLERARNTYQRFRLASVNL